MSEENKLDFIREIVSDDLKSGKIKKVITRFPPEPNGYLHIGHAKAICIDFGIAEEFGGECHLRMDDTNPAKEETEYAENIMNDVKWLGFDYGEKLFHASDYFDLMYECAVKLIKKGKAYVCDLSQEEWEECRGDSTRPGKNPPGRLRSVEENLALFERMKNGDFADGEMVLRAAIDMTSPNIHMRDPVLYRIRHAEHFRHGNKWCIYPIYDFAHPLEDAAEGVTHSICTLEFEIHRPLYDWVLENLDWPNPPRQYEFSRLNLSYTVMSKRKLLQLVKEHYVSGWDDPRMPTLSGMRRRGIPAAAIRNFCRSLGVTKVNSNTDVSIFEEFIRRELNAVCPRFLAVLNPLKVTIVNYPEDQTEFLDGVNNPEDPSAGTRKIPFSRTIYIEKTDFMENPPKGYFRLSPGKEVRLRYAYFITCVEVVKDESGEVVELKCTYDPATRGGDSPDGRKVKGTIHYVDAATAVKFECRLYDRLFSVENPGMNDVDFLTELNPDSLKVIDGYGEAALAQLPERTAIQFERTGYFISDPDSKPDKMVFNRICTLKDSWSKLNKK